MCRRRTLRPFGTVTLFRRARDAPQRVLARVVHRRRRRHRPRQERLDLIRAVAVLLQPQRELEHVLVGRAGMRRDEVRNQVLLLAGRLRKAVEELLELVVRADAGLHHLRQRPFADRLGRDLEIAARVVLRELLDVLGRLDRQVVANARGDQHLLDARQLARLAIEIDQRRVVRVQVRAHGRIDARRPPARRLDLAALARRADTCWPSGRRGRR